MPSGPKAHYFFGSRVVASTTLPYHPYASESLAFFCQTCGDLWARVLVEGGEERWLLSTIPCAKHKAVNAVDWWSVPGSLSQGWYRSNLSVMSWAKAFDCLPLPLQNLEVFHFINHLERLEHAQE